MLLKDSSYSGTSSYSSILDQLEGISFLEEDEYKMEFRELVERMDQ